MFPLMATRYKPIGLGYVPWPLGQAQSSNGGGPGFAPTDVAPLVTAGGGVISSIIGAIRGTPTGYPPGAYPGAPGYVAPFPWGTVVIVGGLAVAAIYAVGKLGKRSNPRRRRRYKVYGRRR